MICDTRGQYISSHTGQLQEIASEDRASREPCVNLNETASHVSKAHFSWQNHRKWTKCLYLQHFVENLKFRLRKWARAIAESW